VNSYCRLLLLVLLTFSPLLAFEVAGHLTLIQSSKADIRQQATRTLDLVETEQQRIVDDIRHIAAALIGMGTLELDDAACQTAMDRLRGLYPDHLAIQAWDAGGRIRCATLSSAVGVSLADRPTFQKAVKSGSFTLGQYCSNARTTGRPSLPFEQPFRRVDGTLVGGISIMLDVGWFAARLTRNNLPEHTTILVADREGTILAHVPEIPGVVGSRLPDRFYSLLRGKQKEITALRGLDDQDRIFAYSPSKQDEDGFFIAVGIDETIALQPARDVGLGSLAVFGGLLVLSCAGAAYGLRLYLLFRDRAEQELRTARATAEAARRSAEEASLSKTRFMASANHDLRQPMQALLILAEVLRGCVTSDGGRQVLHNLQHGLDAMKMMLDAMLDISRFDAGVVQPRIEQFSIGEAFERLSASFEPLAVGKGLQWKVSHGNEVVQTDKLLLERLLRNLAENAIRYTNSGKVEIDAQRVGGYLRIEVSDTGIGIAENQMTLIWEEYHQVGNLERNRAQGLGLGLSIVRRIADLLGYRVTVISSLGQGSAFSIEVPLSQVPSVPVPG
jgi:signal transduction histidine kinase